VARVYAAISNYLARDRLREAIDDVIVIPFADRRADHGVEAVQSVLEQEFGSPDWVRVEVGRGNLRWIYRDA
jgi:hypothetical protein